MGALDIAWYYLSRTVISSRSSLVSLSLSRALACWCASPFESNRPVAGSSSRRRTEYGALLRYGIYTYIHAFCSLHRLYIVHGSRRHQPKSTEQAIDSSQPTSAVTRVSIDAEDFTSGGLVVIFARSKTSASNMNHGTSSDYLPAMRLVPLFCPLPPSSDESRVPWLAPRTEPFGLDARLSYPWHRRLSSSSNG